MLASASRFWPTAFFVAVVLGSAFPARTEPPGYAAERAAMVEHLRALGITSYSLYLIHIIVRDAVGDMGFEMGNQLFFLTMAGGYGLACILYAAIERPFMRLKTG